MHRGQTLRVEAITETRVPFNGDRNYELTPAARGHDAQRPLKVDDVVVVAQDSAPNGDMRVTLPCRRGGRHKSVDKACGRSVKRNPGRGRRR
jgi:hypothetical protein